MSNHVTREEKSGIKHRWQRGRAVMCREGMEALGGGEGSRRPRFNFGNVHEHIAGSIMSWPLGVLFFWLGAPHPLFTCEGCNVQRMRKIWHMPIRDSLRSGRSNTRRIVYEVTHKSARRKEKIFFYQAFSTTSLVYYCDSKDGQIP